MWLIQTALHREGPLIFSAGLFTRSIWKKLNRFEFTDWSSPLIHSLNSLIELCVVECKYLLFLQSAARWNSLKPQGYFFSGELGWKPRSAQLWPGTGARGCACLSEFIFSLQWLLCLNKTKSKYAILNSVLWDGCWLCLKSNVFYYQ